MTKKMLSACFLLATAFTANLAAQDRMDYGPFLSATYVTPWPAGNTTYRGIAVPFNAPIPGATAEGPIAGGKNGKFGKKAPKDVTGGKAPSELYRTNRIAFGGYQLDVPPGSYNVTLHFCEPTENAKGKRVFDVILQGKKVIENLDIFDRVKQYVPLDLSFDNVQVKNGEQLVLQLNSIKGDALLSGFAIEGKGFSRKINCGGGNLKDYVADWPAGFDAIANAVKAGALFDAEMLRYSAVWTNGFLKLDGVVFTGAHGPNPSPQGKVQFGTKPTPGWAASDGNLKDPRTGPFGNLPREWGRFKGLYPLENGVLFKYSVGASEVLDLPAFEVQDGMRFFCRTLNLFPSTQARQVVIADFDAPGDILNSDKKAVLARRGSSDTWITFNGGPAGTELTIRDGSRVVLNIPPAKETARIMIGQWAGTTAQASGVRGAFAKIAPAADLMPLTTGGKARFAQTVTTKGIRGADNKGAYTLDAITVPFNNPYNSRMRFGGLDFFADGRAAITTWSGDVWIVSGIDDKLEKVTWKRFASGLFQPLGLKIVDNVIHVLCRDGIFKLHDLNGDGEADYYECFNNDVLVTKNFHEFIFELHTDPDGNFYFIKGGPVKPGGRGWETITTDHGSLMKLSKDGSKVEVIARGFRAPNGMGLGPNGEITAGDNEGTWMPQCPINWIKPGGFYGVPEFSLLNPKPTIRDNPLCWLPKENPEIDNSNGCQVWITGKNFGPLSGQLLHTSYGTCTLFSVLKEEVGGQMQGGVLPLPLNFDTGICRARFVDKDNALYLVGLRGWQTTATKDAGFYRVRYTGKPAHMPIDLRVTPEAVHITFSDPLDKKSVESAGNFNVQRWNYKWTQNYGSPHFKVSNPKQQGHDDMPVQQATLSADGKTVSLKLADIQPVMQMRVQYQLKAVDGTSVRNHILHTVNVVGDMRGEIHPGEYVVVKGK